MKYLDFIKESRYHTHGLSTVRRQLPKFLKYIGGDSEIEYSDDTDDFTLIMSKMTNKGLNSIISRCGVLGYFPSVFNVNGEYISGDEKTDIDGFISIVQNYDIDISDKFWIQFESWLDQEVTVPKKLYHVTKTVYVDKIKKRGLYPKAKNKISYHPDRIYVVDNYMVAIDILKQLSSNSDDSFSIVTIIPDNDKLILRTDPNYNRGYYTNQNIPSNWIVHSQTFNL